MEVCEQKHSLLFESCLITRNRRLGCVNPESWVPLAAWVEFTQPSVRLILQICISTARIGDLLLLFLPEFHDSKRFFAVADPDADGPQDDVQVVHDEYPESVREALQEHRGTAHGHGSPGDADFHQVVAF